MFRLILCLTHDHTHTHTGYATYAYKTGSSMATPMTAGVGALVLSVLGAGTGNYFQVGRGAGGRGRAGSWGGVEGLAEWV